MKTRLLTVFVCLSAISTPILAERPSIGGLQQELDTLVDALVVCPPGAPTRFVDNGDGTICDHETGLMWEKKDAADGVRDLDNPHDVDNIYSWSVGTDGDNTNPDGTAFTDFLARLNGVVAGSARSEQLGGYSDWRLPTSAELQTIQDCSFGSPCIDPIFGPTTIFGYWSTTSGSSNLAANPFVAWGANFGTGNMDDVTKGLEIGVRAVRGGR